MRAIPAELGPWWKAAQIFIRWARLGVWDRLLDLAQERGVELGMAFLDGTSIRAHAKAAGASKKGDLERSHPMLCGAWTISWRLWYQSHRDRGRVGRAVAFTRAGAGP